VAVFVTELRAVRSMEALKRLAASVADVERRDRRNDIDAVNLVPGDIVTGRSWRSGSRDISLIEARGLEVESPGSPPP
jgi:P-type Ca2+ transporter type 2C